MAIQDILAAWGRGKALTEAPNHIRPPGWTRSIRNSGGATVKAPLLPEEDMIRVDRVISEMKHRKPTHHQVIVYCYLYRLQDGQIARELSGSRSWARETRIAAEHYLEAKIMD